MIYFKKWKEPNGFSHGNENTDIDRLFIMNYENVQQISFQ